MRNYLILAVVVFFCSCDYKSNRYLGTISDIDTTCLEDVKKAELDIKRNNLTYCHYTGNLIFRGLRSEKEMVELLSEYNISFRNEGSSCIVFEDQTPHCYCKIMEGEIKEKYGETFTDSLLEVADEMFVKNNINSTFYYFNCDVRPNYPGDMDNSFDEYSDVLQKELEKMITYPQGYQQRPDYDTAAFTDIHFNVNKNGIAEVKGCSFIFGIKSNDQFKEYFEEQIRKHVRKTGWMPAQIRGYNVNSDMVFRFQFK